MVQAPYLGAIVGCQQLRGELAKEVAQVAHIAQQHALGVVVARCVHRLGQVDDDGGIFRQQDVEFGQIPMHHTRTQHAHHFGNQCGMVRQSLFCTKDDIVEAWGGIAVGIGHQLHQQHPVAKVVGLGYTHASGGKAVEGIDLGALPRGFLLLPPKFAAFGHGAR